MILQLIHNDAFLSFLPWGAGVTVFLIVFGLGWWQRQRRPANRLRDIPQALVHHYGRATTSTAPESVAPAGSPERRTAIRRAGSVVKVALRDERQQAIGFGYVIDRSVSGLGLHTDRAFEPQTMLHVRPTADSERAYWVQVVVRNCRRDNGFWKIGCQFVRPPHWSALLSFE
jgi:hypothetical protein